MSSKDKLPANPVASSPGGSSSAVRDTDTDEVVNDENSSLGTEELVAPPNTTTDYNSNRICFTKSRNESPSNEVTPLLPRPVPDGSFERTAPPSWWKYLPEPIRNFLYQYRWYIFAIIVAITVIVIVVLISTGNVLVVPVVARTVFCFLLSTYFDQYCTRSGPKSIPLIQESED